MKKISDSALEYFKRYDWPGNVRELENVLERAINFLGNDTIIRAEHLPRRITGTAPKTDARSLKELLEETERLAIVNALMANGGHKTTAAKALEISRTSLYEKMQKYKIDPNEKSSGEKLSADTDLSENQTVL